MRDRIDNVIFRKEVDLRLKSEGWNNCTTDKGILMLMELMIKAQAGYYNSHTEENYLRRFDFMKKDRTPNQKGRRFLADMLYAPSMARPPAYEMMKSYRT